MRVLYLSQYFPPEVGATQARAFEMATGLIREGHRVTMLTEVPNHPEGIIRPAYQKCCWQRENLEGIDVIRVWVKTAPVKTMFTRMAFYLTYMINAVLAGLFLARDRYDVIYATSPPLFVGGAGLILSVLRRIPFVFEVRDLWPESAVALGELANPHFVRYATWLEEACYRHARRIVVVTKGSRQHLIERGIDPDKLTLIPNGANTDMFRHKADKGLELRRSLELGDSFLVLYAGIHGIAQDLETVLHAAKQLVDTPGIHFLFVGEGPCKAELAALKKKLALSNVTMLPSYPREKMPDFFSAADAALAPMRRVDLFKGVMPCKMFDAWACGCPVILGIDGEARQVMDQARAGVFVEPESVAALVAAIRSLSDQPEQCRVLGANGRRFVEQFYSRKAQARELNTCLTALCRKR